MLESLEPFLGTLRRIARKSEQQLVLIRTAFKLAGAREDSVFDVHVF